PSPIPETQLSVEASTKAMPQPETVQQQAAPTKRSSWKYVGIGAALLALISVPLALYNSRRDKNVNIAPNQAVKAVATETSTKPEPVQQNLNTTVQPEAPKPVPKVDVSAPKKIKPEKEDRAKEEPEKRIEEPEQRIDE